MKPRFPATPPTVGVPYNASVAYNAHFTYNQISATGFMAYSFKPTAQAKPRTVPTSTMKAR